MTSTPTAGLRRAVLVGAGRMGSAMARGWLSDIRGAGLSALDVIEPSPDSNVEAAAKSGLIGLNSQASPADILILAVKPQAFGAVAPSLAGWLKAETLVISIMAGVTLDRIARETGAVRVARAMPNTPGAIGMGATAYSVSDACGDADVETVQRLLEPLGVVIGPLPETMMDAVTAVSGSGPAYVFFLVEALAQAGREAGLPDDVAEVLARETVVGAGALLGESPMPAADLRQAVTSPGGTTAAALGVLMGESGLSELMKKAVAAAAARGAELAKG